MIVVDSCGWLERFAGTSPRRAVRRGAARPSRASGACRVPYRGDSHDGARGRGAGGARRPLPRSARSTLHRGSGAGLKRRGRATHHHRVARPRGRRHEPAHRSVGFPREHATRGWGGSPRFRTAPLRSPRRRGGHAAERIVAVIAGWAAARRTPADHAGVQRAAHRCLSSRQRRSTIHLPARGASARMTGVRSSCTY